MKYTCLRYQAIQGLCGIENLICPCCLGGEKLERNPSKRIIITSRRNADPGHHTEWAQVRTGLQKNPFASIEPCHKSVRGCRQTYNDKRPYSAILNVAPIHRHRDENSDRPKRREVGHEACYSLLLESQIWQVQPLASNNRNLAQSIK